MLIRAGPPGVHVVRSDPTDPVTVSSAKPEGAQQALVTGASDGDVLVSAVTLRKQAPDLPMTALVSSASVREALREIGIRHAVSAEVLLARTVATTLETPHAGEMVAQLVEADRDILAEVDAQPAATESRSVSCAANAPGWARHGPRAPARRHQDERHRAAGSPWLVFGGRWSWLMTRRCAGSTWLPRTVSKHRASSPRRCGRAKICTLLPRPITM